uniref:Uncharacterized protein n=1 Tax=Pristionchus pacificus TaxID=54126 RepID=A0A2A6BRA9_PRIPA|eukprot:PDM68398.1 hypothetical protein PRIPAC_46442 [Pristionchus pacificus]
MRIRNDDEPEESPEPGLEPEQLQPAAPDGLEFAPAAASSTAPLAVAAMCSFGYYLSQSVSKFLTVICLLFISSICAGVYCGSCCWGCCC